MKTHLPERGMTLLELLVALAIFAIVGTGLYPVVTGALSSRDAATDRVRLDAEARFVLDRLEQDLVGSFDTGYAGPPRLAAPAPGTGGTRGERVLLELTTLVARGVTPADGFVGGEIPAALAVDRGDQAHVVWRYDSSGRLLRQERRPPRTDPVDWRSEPAEVISERTAVALEFYEPETWVEAWDPLARGGRAGRAPLAVRTTVRIDGGETGTVELVSTVVLPDVESQSSLRRGQGRQR